MIKNKYIKKNYIIKFNKNNTIKVAQKQWLILENML
jgi:hypothetical protein